MRFFETFFFFFFGAKNQTWPPGNQSCGCGRGGVLEERGRLIGWADL
jgi:hypothetical protein